ncbi:MAG: DUF4271 domain-containing protein [bacterium]
MLKPALISLLVVMLLHANTAFSQESNSPVPVLDSIDTASGMGILLDTFITNHKPLSKEELQTLTVSRSFSAYGEFIDEMLEKGDWYKIGAKPVRQLFVKRERQQKEWLFYTFIGLFFFIGLINALYSSYITKLIRGYINEGFIFFQAREQLSQYPMASLLMNLFFFFSATFFIFFLLTLKGLNFHVDQLKLLIFIFIALVLLYLLKLIFLNALGWVFNQHDLFRNYVFVVFLSNKIIGLLLLLFSFLMAFASSFAISVITKVAVGVLLVAFLFRFFKGFSLFSKQAKLNLFSFSLAVLSLEVLPTAVLVKFISNKFIMMLTGI